MTPAASGEALPAGGGANDVIGLLSRRRIELAGLAIVLAGWVAYLNSFDGAFINDGVRSVLQNPTIQQGWWEALFPPPGALTVSGRPLVNFSLALNYELGGFNVWGYHAVNLTIQLLAGLTLFGLVRRTLQGPVLRGRYGVAALPLALVSALLWTVHPLQTESVTYVIQRAEVMMGLFYLLTLYCFIRGMESARSLPWHALSATACLLGMFTKETMATAPLMVLLYDRTFIAQSFAAAWRLRRKYYAALAGAWLPLAWIVAGVSLPGNAAVPNPSMDNLNPVMKSLAYALKQCEAIVQYLGLSFWPHPLVFEYGNGVVTNPMDVAPQIGLLILLVGTTIYLLWRQPALGFLGAWFFVILAPTSSVVPLKGQTMAEHHMYLSLASVLVLVVLGLHAMLGRRAYIASLVVVLGLGGLTFERNRDYRTEISISADVLNQRPDDPVIHDQLGVALADAGRPQEALPQFVTALHLNPVSSQAESDLGATLTTTGHPAEGLPHLLRSVALDGNLAEAYINLGMTYGMLNEPDQAREACLNALRINPHSAAAHNNLGNIYLFNLGQLDQAIAEYLAALQADPTMNAAQGGLGDVLMRKNQPADAIPHYAEAIRLRPNFGNAHRGLADALLTVGRTSEAIPEYETALRLMPGDAATHNNFGAALLRLKRYADAMRQFEEALRLNPSLTNARDNLEKARQLAPSS